MADETITADDVTLGEPETAGYKPVNTGPWNRTLMDLPPFNWQLWQPMLIDPTIRLGLSMRAAPLCGAEFAYQDPGDETKWIPGIRAENSVVANYVHRQMMHIWHNELPVLLRSQATGWNACEVTARECNGLVDIDRFFPRKAEDVLVRVINGEPVGVKFLRIKDAPGGCVDLDFPKCVWNPFNPSEGEYYSLPVTFGAYSPWWSKWMKGGALRSLELFMHKSAFGGATMRYPAGTMQVPGKGNVPNNQTAREIVEQSDAGQVKTLPSDRDQKGDFKWVWEDGKVADFPVAVFEYPKMLDTWMLRGIEIPDDVITAEATGAWAGKIVPMTAFYTGLDLWLRRIILNLKRQVIDKYVILNFGRLYWYEITTKPLALQAMEQQGANKVADPGPATQYGLQQQTDPAMGGEDGKAPIQMSLERMVGKGIMDAAKVVRMANKVVRMGKDTTGHDHKDKGPGGGQFTGPGKDGNTGGATKPTAKKAATKGKTGEQEKSSATKKPTGNRTAPPKLTIKAQRAKDNHVLVDKGIQRYAEEHNEPKFAKAVGGVSFPDGEPIDVAIAGENGVVAHGVELKTMLINSNNKITMKRDAMLRKAAWEKKNKAPVHTVVLDDSAVYNANGEGDHDESKRRMFYRRGYGSFRVGTMHEITGGIAELQKLMTTNEADLPPAAQRPAGQKLGRLAA